MARHVMAEVCTCPVLLVFISFVVIFYTIPHGPLGGYQSTFSISYALPHYIESYPL